MLVAAEKYQEFLKTLNHFNVNNIEDRLRLNEAMKEQQDFQNYLSKIFNNDFDKSTDFFLKFIVREYNNESLREDVMIALSEKSNLSVQTLFTAQLMKRFAALLNYDKVTNFYNAILDVFEIYNANKKEIELMSN